MNVSNIITFFSTSSKKKNVLTNKINDLWFEHIKECGIECQISFFFISQLYSDYIRPIESYECYSQM